MRIYSIIIILLLTIINSRGELVSSTLVGMSIEQVDSLKEELIRKGSYKEAYECCIHKLNYYPNVSEYNLIYQDLAYLSSRLGEYEDAITWQETAISKFIDNPRSMDYAMALDALARYNSRSSHYDKSIELEQEAIKIIEEIDGRNTAFANCMSNLAHYWYKKGDFNKAIELSQEANVILRKDTLSSSYVNGLKNIAQYKSRKGEYVEAISIANKARDLMNTVSGTAHPDYANLLSSLSTYHSRLGEYIQATQIETEALGIRQETLGTNHPDYATSLSHLAHYSYKLGNYKDALTYAKEANNIRQNCLTEYHSDYIEGLNELGKYYAESDSIQLAIYIGEKALRLRRDKFGSDNPDYANSLSNLAYYYSLIGNITKALEYEKIVLNLRERLLSPNHPDYAKSMQRLSAYYLSNQELDSAYIYGDIALQIQQKVLGNFHPDIIANYMNMTEVCILLGKYDKAVNYATTATEVCISRIKNAFQSLTNQERSDLWSTYKIWFEEKLPWFIDICNDSKLVSLAYDGILFSKGILLKSERDFYDFLLAKGDKKLLHQYNSILRIRSNIDKIYDNFSLDKTLKLDSLEKDLKRLEKNLILECKEYGDYTKYLSLKWQDVQRNLTDRDVAIEFASFPSNNYRNVYSAYVIRKDMDCPERIRLFNESDLIELNYENVDSLYNNIDVSKLIWEKIVPYIREATDIYFSPDGILHQIAIEYLKDFEWNGQISDRYNLYRLSSTREIVLTKNRSQTNDAEIYGGIQYDTDPEIMVIESSKYDLYASRGADPDYVYRDSLSTRSRYEYLKFTFKEGAMIDSLMKEANFKVRFVSGEKATEESFKSMSGVRKGIVHIATHGFYWNQKEVEDQTIEKNKMPFIYQLGIKSQRNMEDRALTRTGLLMAGANNILRGNEIPQNIDDGILTAKEIANLDFSNLDLAVLSACQTGMGDITSEGVFGLQRGFKKAGTQSILMSLWKVDDEATQILMTEFYRNYLNGMSKREALLSAQKSVREDHHFEDPSYWAAFILLDGLN